MPGPHRRGIPSLTGTFGRGLLLGCGDELSHVPTEAESPGEAAGSEQGVHPEGQERRIERTGRRPDREQRESEQEVGLDDEHEEDANGREGRPEPVEAPFAVQGIGDLSRAGARGPMGSVVQARLHAGICSAR